MTAKKIKQLIVISLLAGCLLTFMFFFKLLMSQSLKKEAQTFVKETGMYCADLLYSRLSQDQRKTEELAEYLEIQENKGISAESTLSFLKDSKINEDFLLLGVIRPSEKGYVVFNSSSTDFAIKENERSFFSRLMKNGSNIYSITIPQENNFLPEEQKGISLLLYSVPIYDKNNLLKGVVFTVASSSLYNEIFSLPLFQKSANLFFILDQNTIIMPPDLERKYGNFQELQKTLFRDEDNKAGIETMFQNIPERKSGYFATTFLGRKQLCIYLPLKNSSMFLGLSVQEEAITRDAGTLLEIGQSVLWMLFVLAFGLFLLMILSNHAEKKSLRHLAFDDAITGHSNFSRFIRDIRDVFQKKRTDNYALIHFDIDKFKIFNERYGYKTGNQLLSYISNTLAHSLSDGELFSRLNSDYFVLLMRYENDPQLLLRLREIRSDIAEYKSRFFYRYDAVVRMGICRIENASIEAIRNSKPMSSALVSYVNFLIDKASLARQSTKDTPLENFYAFYQKEMIEQILTEKEMESEMQSALEHGDFVFYLQPKYSLKNRTIAGAEALVRWIHPGKGTIPPDSFIPLFERNGFVTEIDFYVLEKVCQTLRDWLDKGYPVVPVSVNLSRQHLQKKGAIKKISEIVSHYQIPVHLLEFELTESAMFEKMKFLADFGRKLRNGGFAISIDDFGSGYSSLNMLKDVEVDVLKLDKAFFENENQTRGNQVISKFIELSKSLDMKVVSEGVETQEQVDFLTDVGCDMVQGFYFARPMPASDFENRYLKKTSATVEKEEK